MQRRVRRRDGGRVGDLGDVDAEGVALGHRAALGHAAAVDAHGAELDGALHPRAAQLRQSCAIALSSRAPSSDSGTIISL